MCRPLPSKLDAGSLMGCRWPMEAQTTPSAALVTKFGGRILVGMLLVDGNTDNTVGGPCHQVWRWALCGDAARRRLHRRRLWQPLSSSSAPGSLWGDCRPTGAPTMSLAAIPLRRGYWSPEAQMMHLVALVTKFGSGLPAGKLLADGDADNVIWLPSPSSFLAGSLLGCCCPTAAQKTPLVALAIKFGSGLPSGRLLADGGADNTFGGPRHQVWWGIPCWDAAD